MQSELDPVGRLIEEFFALRRAGTSTSAEEFARAHPDHADRLRELLRTAELVEDAGVATSATRRWSRARMGTEPPAGVLFGDYRIVRELGRGGMGVVYEAIQAKLGRRVALKVLEDRRISNAADLARFQREAGITSKLEHPNICPVYETGEHEGEPFLAMRLLEGETLASRIARARQDDARGVVQLPSDPGESGAGAQRRSTGSGVARGRAGRAEIVAVVRLVEKVARALHFAHQKGVLHRDVKPGNIMVGADGEPVVMDFGLGRDVSTDDQRLTRTGEMFGTPAYMPPEQILGRRGEIDAQSDVYALGVTLYECLTLRLPFESRTRDALYRAILTVEPADPRQHAPALPSDLAVVVLTAMEKSRAHRYASALALADDLRAVAEHRPISARPISRWGRARRWARRQPAQAALLAVLVLGVPALAASLGFVVANIDEVRAAERAVHVARLETVLEDAFLALGEQRYEGARESFRAALALEPGDVAAVCGLALAHEMDGEAAAAVELVERAMRDGATHPALARVREEARARAEDRAPVIDAVETAELDPLSAFLEAARLRREVVSQDRAELERALELAHHAVVCTPRARALYHFQWALAAGDLADETEARRVASALAAQWPASARAWYCVGFALDAFDRDASRRAFELAVELDPAMAPAHQSLALDRLIGGDPEAALASAQRAVELDPDDALLWETVGIVELRRARFERARAAFEACLERMPEYAGARVNLARILLHVDGDAPGALGLLEDALALDPLEPITHLTLADVYQRLNRPREALASAQRASELEPDMSFGWTVLGRLQHEQGDHAGAERSLRRSLELGGGNAFVRGRGAVLSYAGGFGRMAEQVPLAASTHTYLAAALAELGRSDEALEHARRACELASRSSFHLGTLGRLEVERGAYQAAIEPLSRAVELDPTDAPSHGLLATALVQLGRADEALPHLRTALDIDPTYPLVWVNYGVALHKIGDYAGAVDAYAEARARGPDSALLLNNLGLALLMLDRHEEALEALDAALAHDPSHTEAHDNRGIALDRLGRLDESVAAHRRAVELDPAHYNAHHKYYDRLAEAGQWEAALAEAERWTGVRPDESASWSDLAQGFLDADLPLDARDPVRALQAAERAIELAGDHDVDGWELLARVQHAVGDVEVAIETLEHARTLLGTDDAERARALDELVATWRAAIE